MAKVSAHIMVRGVDLQAMLAEVRRQLTDLADVPWTVTDVQLSPQGEDIAASDGMLPMWTALVTLEANV